MAGTLGLEMVNVAAKAPGCSSYCERMSPKLVHYSDSEDYVL